MVLRGTVCRFKQNHMDSWVNEANYRVGFKQLSTTQNLVHKGESETISRETNSIQFKSVKLQKATISPIRFITWVITVHAGAYPTDHVGKMCFWLVVGISIPFVWPKSYLPKSMLNLKFRPPKSVIF